MQIQPQVLLNELAAITVRCSEAVQQLKDLSVPQLNHKENPGAWSVLECIEHLNLYGDFYLPEIEQRILSQKQKAQTHVFKSGIIGNYFAKLMQVKEGKITKMKSPADKNPVHSHLTVTTLDRFLKQQERLQKLLAMARDTDLTRTKTAISLTKWIRLRLGDTFRVVVYHIERHVLQAQRAANNAAQ